VNLDAIRAELPVLARVAFLNSGTFGPLPRRSVEAMIALEREELEQGRAGSAYWHAVWARRQAAREAVGRLIGAPASSVALTRSTTEGCSLAIQALRLGPGDEVLTTDVEHFGLLGPLRAAGVSVRMARVRERPASEALSAIEAELGPGTRLVALSHVSWLTGQVLPVAELAGRGFPVLVDGAQSAGSIPLRIPELGCDFYTVSGQKWCLGPDGTGALYVSPAIVDSLRVPLPSYFGIESRDEEGDFVPAAGAQRLETGTIPAPALAGLVASLEFALELGPERFERARAMAKRCRALLAERVEVVTEPGQATLVSFRPSGDPAETVERLARQGVVVRDLPGVGWVRVSVGFWTAEDELERLCEAL
jgi:L-cysteine/cystine lyase